MARPGLKRTASLWPCSSELSGRRASPGKFSASCSMVQGKGAAGTDRRSQLSTQGTTCHYGCRCVAQWTHCHVEGAPRPGCTQCRPRVFSDFTCTSPCFHLSRSSLSTSVSCLCQACFLTTPLLPCVKQLLSDHGVSDDGHLYLCRTQELRSLVRAPKAGLGVQRKLSSWHPHTLTGS